MTKLTTKDYWEDYYKKSITQNSQIKLIASVYDYYWELLIKNNEVNPPETIIEIGGYPGRYLAYLADKYNLIPTSLDFNTDRIKIEESMEAFGIKEYEIIVADFFEHEPNTKYDIVISNGFIEHFDNYHEVLNLHLKYLKKGGTLLVMIPNMTYYIKFYKLIVDKKNLSIHNLKCMNLKIFKEFAETNNLSILKNEYFGGFPFSVHQKNNLVQKLVFKIHRLLFKFFLNKFIMKRPTKYLSQTIISIYKN